MPTDPDYPYYQDPNARSEPDEPEDDGDDDFEFDPLGPDEHDAHLLDEDAREDEIRCPECGELTYDDAPQCHHCGHWMMEKDGGSSGMQYLMTALVVAALTVALFLWMAQI